MYELLDLTTVLLRYGRYLATAAEAAHKRDQIFITLSEDDERSDTAIQPSLL